MELPSISIITPSYNQGRFLEATLRSVLEQGYARLEHLVIDGGSTDESVEVIRRYQQHLAYWVSERDRGQVHAINKGLAKATGDVVAFLNSDDLHLPGALAAVGDHFQRNPACQWLCGDTILFGEKHATSLVHAIIPKSAAHCLCWAYKAPQPGMFWKRELLQGGFQECWPFDFDHDMYIRLLLAGQRCEHLPVPVAAYRLHPTSKTVAEGARQIEEFERIAEHYESRLRGADRRWCAATRLLRRSYAASQAGQARSAAVLLLRALHRHPESVAHRPFWGCLRRLFLSALDNAPRDPDRRSSPAAGNERL
ncbi:MAG: glycosyltransferase family 2 protein [Candidatus Sulfotelmatobacter sp.]